MSNEEQPLRINLNEEQTLRFLSFFVDEARRIATERKKENSKQKNEFGV